MGNNGISKMTDRIENVFLSIISSEQHSWPFTMRIVSRKSFELIKVALKSIIAQY